MYECKLDGSGKWTKLIPTSDTINTIAHSIMRDLVVGNHNITLIQGEVFIYDVKSKKFHNIEKEGTKSITA